MKVIHVICDSCHKEFVSNKQFGGSKVTFNKKEYGSEEENDNLFIEGDLCQECARKLSKFLDNELHLIKRL